MNRSWIPVVAALATTCAGPASLAAGAEAPRAWAIVIGIDRYDDPAIPRCTGAVRDARAVADWFASTAGWGGRNVLRMSELGRREHGPAGGDVPDLLPTLDNLNWAVTDWLDARARKGDVVVIYFAGQATARPPRPGAQAGRAYLLPVDAAAAGVDRTGWSVDEALDRAGTAKKARVVLWLDTSTRGRGTRGLPLEAGAPSGGDWLRSLTRWPGVTAWLAADGRPAPEEGSPGPFVASLLKATGGPARAHNLLGTLKGLRDDPDLMARGFRTMGGVAPSVSLWSAGARVVEEAVPELIVQAGHADRVTSAVATADGSRLITASQDSTVRIWDLADRSLVRVLTESIGGIEALAMDRDGGLVVAGDNTGRIVGWDMTRDRPRPLYGPAAHEDGIDAIAFLPDGRSFVSLDRRGRSFLWDAAGATIANPRPFSAGSIVRLAAAATPGPGAPAMVAAIEGPDDGPSFLRTFDAQGRPVARIDGPGGRVTALHLSADGRRIAVGDDEGPVKVLRPAGPTAWEVAWSSDDRSPIRLVRPSGPTGMLLVADDRELRLHDPAGRMPGRVLADPEGIPVPGGVDRAEFSTDGRWLAACTPGLDGRTLAWNLADPARPAPVAIPGGGVPGLSPTFGGDGRTLFVGDVDGGLRSWRLEGGPGGPRAEALPRILPARGRVAILAPSPSGRSLLEITRDDVAMIWDLDRGRGAHRLPGAWISGAFLPDDEATLVLATRPDRPGEGGDVVLFDRDRGRALPIRFERPTGVDGRPSLAAFGKVVVSKSGRWIAGASLEAQLPLACVWRRDTGRLVQSAREHNSPLTAVDFSGDEATLLTASEDGAAKLWPMAGPGVELLRPSATFFVPGDGAPAITAARFCPTDPRRVVVGTRAGLVFLWDREEGGKVAQVELGRLEGEVGAAAFSADGRWLAASARLDKSIRFWSLAEGRSPREVAFRPRPHHAERVGALAAWPDGSMIVSGGDDSAIRFWSLKDRSLVGTLLARARDGVGVAVDWLAFTPEGLFDGSMPGQAMVKWRVGDRIVTLEQSEDTHHTFQVARAIARGDRPELPRARAEAPELKIVGPPEGRDVGGREVELTVWAGDRDLTGLRLYQNGVPVRADGDFRADAGPNLRSARVRLRKGENRFYAMASRAGADDGRSQELTLRYDGPEPPGLVHTIALGISRYDHRPLKYADVDARRIAEFLEGQGLRDGDRAGERIILVDDKVTEPNIDAAFLQVREAVRGRPQDTVVLFIAGHTDTDDDSDQFCLLLPRFPFPAEPVAGAGAPGFALRGNVGPGGPRARVGDPNVLPYVILFNRLARVEALHRLIVIDACQAGAIRSDPAVRNIQRLVDRGARRARNSYLLAARRGEPANEADALGHGLLTYTLLRGMGATGLRPIPDDLGGFPGPPSADLDGDGFVSSNELVAYTDQSLPRLARLFPELVRRAGGPLPAAGPPPELEKDVTIRAAEESFRLIPHPAGPK